MILNQAKRCILFRVYINRCKMKKKNKDLNESVEAIESMADAFDQISYMLKNNIPFEVEVEEESEYGGSVEDIEEDKDLGFLQDEEDMDDLDFDEMNDVWDEMDEGEDF